MDGNDALRALPEAWRERRDRLDPNRDGGRRMAYEHCANELQAALAASSPTPGGREEVADAFYTLEREAIAGTSLLFGDDRTHIDECRRRENDVVAAAELLRAHILAPRTEAVEEMCPNCVTPWKCNGPHTPPAPQGARQEALRLIGFTDGASEGKYSVRHWSAIAAEPGDAPVYIGPPCDDPPALAHREQDAPDGGVVSICGQCGHGFGYHAFGCENKTGVAAVDDDFRAYVKARTTVIRIASEMQAWAEKKMGGPGSSRIDRAVLRAWAIQLLGDEHVD